MTELESGPVPQPQLSGDELCAVAFDWSDRASNHMAQGESHAMAWNLDAAIEQYRFAETKIATCRVKLTEARERQAMENGS